MKYAWYNIPNKPRQHARSFVKYLERQGENIVVEKNGNYWNVFIQETGLENFMT